MRKKTTIYTILVLYAFISLYPFVWSLLASLHGNSDILLGDIVFGQYTLKHYIEVLFEDQYFKRWIFNSCLIALVGTIVTVTFNTMAGYAISRLNFKSSKFLLTLVLIVLVIPGQCLMIPNYIIVTKLGLIDSYAAFIVPGLVSATYIYMMSQFFRNTSIEVEEAAHIDGLNRIQIFFKVAVPMAKPAVITQTIFIFMGYWNTFQPSVLYMQSREMFSLQHGLQSFQNSNSTSWGMIMAGAIVSMIPILIVYILENKHFVNGVSMGSGK